MNARTNPDKDTINVRLGRALACAVVEISAELEARDDVFDTMTDADVARKLIAYAITEHRAGRGPWPRATR